MFLKSIGVSAVFLFVSSAAGAAVNDNCLIGAWVPEDGAFAAQMAANPGMGEVEVSGDVQMLITAAGGQYMLDGLVIKMQQPNMPPVQVDMTGSGAFSGDIEGGRFAFTMGEFNYAARATISMGGAPVVMDIPFSEEMAPMGGGATGSYVCSETELHFEVDGEDGKMLENWVRP